jgi:RNA polymerase sigma factor (sigma-70 family)
MRNLSFTPEALMSQRSAPLLRQLNKLAHTSALQGAADQELLERFASRRDQDAFAVLVRRHGPMVLGVCRSVLGQEQDAEDASQATFLVLARKPGGLWRPEAVGPWLHGVAYRLALRVRSAAQRNDVRAASGEPRLSVNPAAELILRGEHTLLHTELASLPARYRGPLVLCYLQGSTRDEAAQQLRCPVATLKSRLERGCKLLRTRLARRGLGLPAALTSLLLSEVTGTAFVQAGFAQATSAAAVAFAAGGGEVPGVPAHVLSWAAASLRVLTAVRRYITAGLTVDGRRVTFILTRQGTLDERFDGLIDMADSNKVLGSLWMDGATRAERAVLELVPPGPRRKPRKPDLPLEWAKYLELAGGEGLAAFAADGPVFQAKTPAEQETLRSAARAAQQRSLVEMPKLFRKLVAEQPDSPFGYEAAVELIGRTNQLKPAATEIVGWVKAARMFGATHGRQFEAATVGEAASVLARHAAYADMARKYAAEADQLARVADLPEVYAARVAEYDAERAAWASQSNPPSDGSPWEVTLTGRVMDARGTPVAGALCGGQQHAVGQDFPLGRRLQDEDQPRRPLRDHLEVPGRLSAACDAYVGREEGFRDSDRHRSAQAPPRPIGHDRLYSSIRRTVRRYAQDPPGQL